MGRGANSFSDSFRDCPCCTLYTVSKIDELMLRDGSFQPSSAWLARWAESLGLLALVMISPPRRRYLQRPAVHFFPPCCSFHQPTRKVDTSFVEAPRRLLIVGHWLDWLDRTGH
jgi:hypothetical protein